MNPFDSYAYSLRHLNKNYLVKMQATLLHTGLISYTLKKVKQTSLHKSWTVSSWIDSGTNRVNNNNGKLASLDLEDSII